MSTKLTIKLRTQLSIMLHKIGPLVDKYAEILRIFGTSEAKLVGGCVRDYLKYGKFVEDVDISTILAPKEVIAKLLEYKQATKKYITILDRDAKYGTVVAIIEGQRYEITTTRADINCHGRQAEVAFCRDFEADSGRRDFTINALYVGLDGQISDFHGGLRDLENNKITFIGDADKRVKEDFLRIVRYFRFATKFGLFTVDDGIISIFKSNAEGLKNISRERFRSEIWKLLSYEKWQNGLEIIQKSGLLCPIFGLKTDPKTRNDVINIHDKNFEQIVKLFYFFDGDKTVMSQLTESFKLTKKEQNFLTFLQNFHTLCNCQKLSLDAKIFIFNAEKTDLKTAMQICDEDIKKEINDFLRKLKPLPITPTDILNTGIKGKEIGDAIKKLTEIWIKDEFGNTKEELMEFL